MNCDRDPRADASKALDQFVEEYVVDYVFEGDEGSHYPDEATQLILSDAINGLLAEDEFLDLVAKVASGRERPRAQCARCHGVGMIGLTVKCPQCNGEGLEP